MVKRIHSEEQFPGTWVRSSPSSISFRRTWKLWHSLVGRRRLIPAYFSSYFLALSSLFSLLPLTLKIFPLLSVPKWFEGSILWRRGRKTPMHTTRIRRLLWESSFTTLTWALSSSSPFRWGRCSWKACLKSSKNSTKKTHVFRSLFWKYIGTQASDEPTQFFLEDSATGTPKWNNNAYDVDLCKQLRSFRLPRFS